MKTQTFFQIALTISLVFVLTSGKVEIEKSSELISGNVNSSYIVEEMLEIEPWMVDDTFWNKQADKESASDVDTQLETELDIEQWMTDDKLWKI